jgi:dihydroflavonol-4-reductase
MQTAFVTGSTGLLGNNLVRELVRQGVHVKGLARSKEKARQQFADLNVDIIEGDMTDVPGFALALRGCDALFHTAAHFRDCYKGGQHAKRLQATNVEGTSALLEAAHRHGLRNIVHTSSIAVLDGPPGLPIDETMERDLAQADDYYRSKILSDQAVMRFLGRHPDTRVTMVLPGWMFGPGDLGPTSAGQLVLDFAARKLPGRIPGTFSVVDARDVAQIQLSAMRQGQSGHRYLAAGRNMTMDQLFPLLAQATGVSAPSRAIPLSLLKVIAWVNETQARLTGAPALISRAAVRLLEREAGRTQFNQDKTLRELHGTFRPVLDTLVDTVAWYRQHGWLTPAESPHMALSG